MYDTDKLKISKATEQTQEMIKALTKNNEQLELCVRYVNAFRARGRYNGRAYEELQRHLEDVMYTVRAMESANDMQIEDCNRYLLAIGDENLIGKKIFYYKDMYKSTIDESKKCVEEFTEKINAGCNLVMEAYYRSLIAMYKANLVIYPPLYEHWKKKYDKYDEIQATTQNLFSGLSDFRAEIRNTFSSMIVSFRGTEFLKRYRSDDVKSSLDEIWKATLEVNANKKLKRDYFVSIHDEDKDDYYGVGEQMLCTGTQRGEIQKRESSVIAALMNLDMYLFRNAYPAPSRNENSRDDYRSMSNFLKSANDYITSSVPLNKILRKVEKKPEDYEYSAKELKGCVEEIAKRYGYENVSWETTDQISLAKIQNQLERNIPVLYFVGDSVTPEPPLIAYERDHFDKERYEGRNDPKIILNNTMVTITGTETIVESNGKTNTLLQISAEGKKCYVEYKECVYYKEQHLKCMDEEHADRYNKQGYNNISYIGY